jgi:dTDP-glucose pyrophosphorylase
MKSIFINPYATIKDTLKKLDRTAEKVLLIVNEDRKLLGTITDGDIRRHLLKTGSLEGSIEGIFNKNPSKIFKNEIKRAKEIFIEKKIELIPIVDENNRVVDFIRWVDVFDKTKDEFIEAGKIEVPVVIMAGGKGKRLEPFTRVLPKPLIPVGEKTVIEHVIDSFRKFGVKKFYLTLNYKGKLIEAYFNSIKMDYDVEFVWEENFLGTAGSLYYLKDHIKGNFFVSNCDVILKADYFKVHNFHNDNNSIFTSITSIQHFRLPYGVVETGKNGVIEKIIEKPEHTIQINTGVYLLNDKCLEYIGTNDYLDMPFLIKKLVDKGEKVIAYPVNENNYIDIGQWEEYKKALNILR